MNHVCIVIPVYNNPKTIKNVIKDSLLLDMFVIVVDDGSDIEVSSLLETDTNLTILRHEKNQGKGLAILRGAKEARERGFEYLISIDGDGQHYPKEVAHLLPLLKNGNIVIGNRKFEENVPNSSKFGRQFSNFWIWTETGKWLGDTQSGFRGYPLSILDLELTHNHYDLEIEVLVKHLWSKKEIKEVEIEVYYPPKGTRVSHFDKVEDNLRLSKIHSKLFFQNILRVLRLTLLKLKR